jgi:phosphoribosyl-AMP cyclohydrolase
MIPVFASRGDRQAVEHGLSFMPKFDKDGLIPAIATDIDTGDLLMVAYMNEESLKRTLEIGEAVYYSRSRQELWHKGATSGHVQKVHEIRTDCDQDALWLKVKQLGGGACHNGFTSCFYRAVDLSAPANKVATAAEVQLQQVISDKTFDPDQVYRKK